MAFHQVTSGPPNYSEQALLFVSTLFQINIFTKT